MGESADQIRQELDQKRADASRKIEQLEDQVTHTAEEVKQNVQETVDLRHQIEQRPLIALGTAFVGGFLLGGILGGDDDKKRQGYYGYGNASSYQYQGNDQGSRQQHQGESGGSISGGLKKAAKDSGLESTITNAAAAAMATASDRLKSTIDQSFPGFASKYDTAQETEGGFSEKGEAARSTSDSSSGASHEQPAKAGI
jgi:ElaB/YqjD/DUF883 family membrane-anchored ribosome-binding protein